MMGHDTRGNIGHLTNTARGTRGAAHAPPYAADGPAWPAWSYTAGMPRPADDTGDSVAKCVFCAIIRGEVTATAITETAHLIAFLDHRPLFRGHTLLMPKTHLRLLSDLPAGLAAEF